MNKIVCFLKSTKWISRIFFVLWAILILIITIALWSAETDMPIGAQIALYVYICFVFSTALLIPAFTIAMIERESNSNNIDTKSEKNWLITLLLSIFTGWLGGHRFYTGHIITGIIYLFTFGGFYLGVVIDMILIIIGRFPDKKGYSIFRNCKRIESTDDYGIIEGSMNSDGQSASTDVQKKDNKKSEHRVTKHIYVSAQMVMGILLVLPAIELLVLYVKSKQVDDHLIPAIVCLSISAVLFIKAPKTKEAAEERKQEKQAKKKRKQEQKEYARRMLAYKGIFLAEEQIHRLEDKQELPIVETPVFLNYGEVAVYYCEATRQETKNRVIGRIGGYAGGTVRIAKGFSGHTGRTASHTVYGDVSTHYEGKMVLTNKRLVFLSDQEGFEVPYNTITAATAYSDGLSIQSRRHIYTLLLPKADLAVIAFNAVRTGEIPIADAASDFGKGYSDAENGKIVYVDDDLFTDAVDAVMETHQASVSIIQRRLKLGYTHAARLIDEMEAHKIVGPFKGSTPRQILISSVEWENMKENIILGKEYPNETLDSDENIDNRKDDISCIDGMDGHKFEYFCADLLRKNGFSEVKVTPGSGDQGVDILAEKGGVKYAIQCKNYASPLSNTPVQEVNAGKVFYGCHVGVVMTNSTFTPGAVSLAKATGVLLWDRAVVQKMMEDAS